MFYLAEGSITLIIIHMDYKVAPSSLFDLLRPAGLICVCFLASHNRNRFATNFSIQGNVLYS